MAMVAEGVLEIPLEVFYEWVNKTYNIPGMEVVYGPPQLNKSTNSLDLLFAMGDETDPNSWATKPDAVLAWNDNNFDVPN